MDNSAQAIEEARRVGIDLDLLEVNLALSVKERWAQHRGALELAMKLEAARQAKDERLQPTTAPTR